MTHDNMRHVTIPINTKILVQVSLLKVCFVSVNCTAAYLSSVREHKL